MSKYLLLIFNILFCINLYSQNLQKSDSEQMDLKGNIKELYEYSYISESNENGKIKEVGNPYAYNRLIKFNKSGNITEEYWYINNKGRNKLSYVYIDATSTLHSSFRYYYNNKNLLDSCLWKDRDENVMQKWIYKHDSKGNKTQKTWIDCINKKNNLENYTYNNRGLLTQTEYIEDTTSYLTLTKQKYDSKGRLTKESQGNKFENEYTENNLVSCFYDDSGNMIKEYIQGDMCDYEFFYTYNSNKQIESITAPHVEEDTGYNRIYYVYDTKGNLLLEQTMSIWDTEAMSNSYINTEIILHYSYNYDEHMNWVERRNNVNNTKLNREILYYEE